MERQLAHALVEYETLDRAEVEKVIKGEPIRSITEVMKEELAEVERLETDSQQPLAEGMVT